MPTVTFDPPTGSAILNPEPELLRQLVLTPPEGYWLQGSGGATLEWSEGPTQATLLIGENEEYGYYLHYIRGEEDWLSLQDRANLDTTADARDEWDVSVGLFLPAEKAWLAVEEFCRTG